MRAETLFESAKKNIKDKEVIPPGKIKAERKRIRDSIKDKEGGKGVKDHKYGPGINVRVHEKRYKIAIMEFDNLTDNYRNDYLTEIITAILYQELNRSGRYHVEVEKREKKSDTSFSEYQLKTDTMGKLSAMYSADYLISGYYLVKKDFLKITTSLYVARQDKIIKLSISRNNFKVQLKEILFELSMKIESEIFKLIPKRELKKKSEKALVREAVIEPGKKDYHAGLIGLYGFVDPVSMRTRLTAGQIKMISFIAFWDLGNSKSLSKISFIRNISLIGEVDLLQGSATKPIFESNPTALGSHFHHTGLNLGFNYKFSFGRFLSLNVNAAAGYSRSQTSSAAVETRGLGYIKPPDKQFVSWDLSMSSRVIFNVYLNPNASLIASFAYKQVRYSTEPLVMLVYQAGGSLRF